MRCPWYLSHPLFNRIVPPIELIQFEVARLEITHGIDRKQNQASNAMHLFFTEKKCYCLIKLLCILCLILFYPCCCQPACVFKWHLCAFRMSCCRHLLHNGFSTASLKAGVCGTCYVMYAWLRWYWQIKQEEEKPVGFEGT